MMNPASNSTFLRTNVDSNPDVTDHHAQGNRFDRIQLPPGPDNGAANLPSNEDRRRLAQRQRRVIKDVARISGIELRAIGGTNSRQLPYEVSGPIDDRLTTMRANLASYMAEDLSTEKPVSKPFANAKNGVVMAAAAVGAMGATVAAGTAGTVQLGLSAIALSIKGTTYSVRGFRSTWKAFPMMSTPAKVALSVGAGIASGTTMAVVLPLVEGPKFVGRRGEWARSTFRKLNNIPQAREHAAYKTMSTKEIAEVAYDQLTEAIKKLERKSDKYFYKYSPVLYVTDANAEFIENYF